MKRRRHENEDDEVTYRVIGCAFDVHQTLGSGHAEHIYRDAMYHVLSDETDFDCDKEVEIDVTFRGESFGTRYADLLINGNLVVELKALKKADKSHFQQLGINVEQAGATRGLLLNFGADSLDIWRYEPRGDGD